jgi:hypothetical protein
MSACDTCAFGCFGGAADEPYNRLRGAITAAAGIPFFCHHDRSGREFGWAGDDTKSLANFYKIPPDQRKVCEGWKTQVGELARSGHFRVTDNAEDHTLLLRYQRMLGIEALATLDELIEAKDHAEREGIRNRLESLLEALRVHRSYDLLNVQIASEAAA